MYQPDFFLGYYSNIPSQKSQNNCQRTGHQQNSYFPLCGGRIFYQPFCYSIPFTGYSEYFKKRSQLSYSAFSIFSLCSWLLIHTLFTLRYAHLYYTCKYEEDGIKKLHEGGLDFPKETAPDYLD